MTAPSRDTRDDAEDVFARFLERLESGEQADFAEVCREHAALAPTLHRIHGRWQTMIRAFGELSRIDTAAPPVTAASPAVDALLQKLGASGVRIDRYAIGPEIAHGGMGRVVQAWDAELRRAVALKVLRGDPVDARQRRRFLEEAQIAAQLDHPGIVPIHELGLDADGRPFFSMKLVRGLDLDQVLAAARAGRDGWTRTRVLHVLLRACEAVAFAHSKGVVHRDLKPANIMVGAFHETYVMDWGLAHVAGSDGADLDTLRAGVAAEAGGSPLLTGGGDVIGTPAYMAPEQAATGTADVRVDVYAFGAILYHLLAGHRPYGDRHTGTADAVLAQLAAGAPTRIGDDVPGELRAICERAMARDPAARYPGVAALADDLRAYLELRTVRAYATGPWAELSKWVARNRPFAAVSSLLLLALLAGAAAATALWVRAERNRQRADATATRLADELDRSAFRSARLALQVDNSSDAADALWRSHLQGRTSRATSWALLELAERDPYLTTLPVHAALLPVAFAAAVDAVLVGAADGRLQVRDPVTLALRRELGAGGAPLTALAAHAAEPTAIAGDGDGDITVFDLGTGATVQRREAHRGRVRELAATASGAFLSGGEDGRVLLWPSRDAAPVELMQLPTAIGALAARADGVVAAGDQLGTVAATALDGSTTWRLQSGSRQVMSLAFDDDPDVLWAGGSDHMVRRLRLTTRAVERTVATRNGSCRQLQLDRDGSLLVAGWWRIDRLSADSARPVPLALRGASSIALQSVRRLLVTAGANAGLGLLDLGTADRRRLPGHTIALADDGRRVATLEGDVAVVRDVDTAQVVATLPAADAACVQLSPDGAIAAIAAPAPGRVRLVGVDDGRERFAVEGPTEIPLREAVAFATDGSEVATLAGDARIERRAPADGTLVAVHEVAGAHWIRLRYSADGRWLCAIRRGSSAVWRLDRHSGVATEIPFTVDLPGGLAGSLSAFAVSSDGSLLAVGTWQGQVLVRSESGPDRSIAAHGGTVWSLAFAPTDDGLLFSAGGAQGVAAWDLDTLECCHQAVRDHVVQLHLSRDLRTLACTTPDGPLLLDLGYRRRHVAGNLAFQLERQRQHVAVDPERERELRAWATAVLAEPWPRWR